MAFLFKERITSFGQKPQTTTHPFAAEEEYAALIKRESGVPLKVKQELDRRFQTQSGKGVGSCGTLINTIKCSVGAGILSFPYGFYVAGWLGALTAFLVITLPVLYCLHTIGTVRRMLLEDEIRLQKMTGLRADPSITEEEIKRLALESRDYLEFPDLAELSVGKKLRAVVTVLVLMGQLGCCAAYVIFIGNNMSYIGASFGATASLPRVAYVSAVFPLILLLSFVKTLRGLLPIAALGTLLLIAGLAVVGVHGVRAAEASNHAIAMPPMLGDGVILFIGMVLFSMESVTQMPVLQASMEKPAKFPRILNVSIFGLLILYLVVGLGGAALFGADVDSIITRNLGLGVLGQVARGLFCAMLLSTFPFQMFPAATIVERFFKPLDAADYDDEDNNQRSMCTRLMTNFFVVRTVLCMFVILIAMSFEDFGQFLSLIGYPAMGTLGLVIPPIMCLSLDMRSKEGRLSSFDRTLCWIILCVGAVGCLCGTIWTLADVAKGKVLPETAKDAEKAAESATKFFFF